MTTLLAQATTSTDAIWRLQTHWVFAPWLTFLLIGGAALLVVYCYARERTTAGVVYRSALGLLRMATIALILVMLSELLLAGTRSGRPRFGWIIDLSGSMTIDDPTDKLPDTRIEQVKQALLADDGKLLATIAAGYDTQLVTAGQSLETVAGAPKELAEKVVDLQADESAMSRLGDAIASQVNSAAQAPPQAIAIWTDGRNTAGVSLSAAAEAARRAGTPLFFIGVGSQDSPPDVSLSDPLADEVVFVEDLLSFGATLRVDGDLASPMRVVLRREGDSSVLAEQLVQPTGASIVPIQVIHRPTTPGEYRYTMSVAPVEGERDADNNAVSFDVQVRDAHVRVLLAAGYPMYEFRYLKSLLERDSTVELETFLQESDLEYASADQTAINRFPLRQSDFDQYDVVVLMDLDSRLLPRSAWRELSQFVSNDGGGVVLVAGSRYLPWTYKGINDFRDLAPTAIETAPVASRLVPQEFQLRPTTMGLRVSSFQLGDNRAESETVWRRLAPMYWCAELGDPKPAAQVLATHPTATTPDGKPLPLVVSHYFGGGQVLMHGVDATYLWRKRVGDVYFARYWVQTLRRLAHGRLKRDDRGWELAVERTEYRHGEPVRVRLRTPRDATQQATILLQPERGAQRRVKLTPSAVRPGVLEADLEQLPVGRYRVLLAGGDTEAASAAFEVVKPPGEFAQIERDTAAMRAAAERTGGRYLSIEEAADLLESLPEAQRVPIESLPPIELWNRWWMLAGICGCLVCEWILRKRKSML